MSKDFREWWLRIQQTEYEIFRSLGLSASIEIKIHSAYAIAGEILNDHLAISDLARHILWTNSPFILSSLFHLPNLVVVNTLILPYNAIYHLARYS